MRRSATDLLRRADVFARLPEPELRQIGKLLNERRIGRNHVLFRQGESAEAMYIVVDGRIRIATSQATGRERVLAFLGPGEIVGEMGLLSGDARSATATAVTETRVLQLSKADFDALLANNLNLMRELARVVARRRAATQRRLLAETSYEGRGPSGIVSVIFSPRGGAGATTLATNLAVALAHRAPDSVALVDLNVLFGHVPLLLDLNPRTSLAAISAASIRQMERETLEFYLTTHADSSLRVLAGVLRPEEGELVTSAHVKASLELLRRMFLHVIVDVGRGFSEPNLAALESAHNLLIVCTADRAGVRAVTECQRICRELLHLPHDPLQYLLNHPGPYLSLSPDQLEHVLNVRLISSIPYGGEAVARAALEGHPVVSRSPHSGFSKAVIGVAERMQAQIGEALQFATRTDPRPELARADASRAAPV
ncbi:MAG TPA: cyclic nucleotide-binding domain-containing protein [Chloroflexota bacterium]|jgi:CRP-like cAMP-binding protein